MNLMATAKAHIGDLCPRQGSPYTQGAVEITKFLARAIGCVLGLIFLPFFCICQWLCDGSAWIVNVLFCQLRRKSQFLSFVRNFFAPMGHCQRRKTMKNRSLLRKEGQTILKWFDFVFSGSETSTESTGKDIYFSWIQPPKLPTSSKASSPAIALVRANKFEPATSKWTLCSAKISDKSRKTGKALLGK